MLRTVFFLGGDSYPADRHIETALGEILTHEHAEFVPYDEVLRRAGETSYSTGIDVRLAMLERALQTVGDGRDVFLVGQSAGARIVTLFASRHSVSAAVGIAYPFRQPPLILEPERFAHLATLSTPTLIVQGINDEYGGIELTENYLLSESIKLRFFRGKHGFDPASTTGAYALGQIRDFIEGGWRNGAEVSLPFDENFYLMQYGDVASAVAAGDIKSGEEHFRLYGRTEHRRYRLLPASAAL